jgi:beta-lactamase superfamily II metal-dependent hydrolase
MMKYNRRTFITQITALGVLTLGKNTVFAVSNPKEKTLQLPDWKEGWLDIHHISTGRGNSAFIICPDGTTMLIDAGERRGDGSLDVMSRVPDGSKTPGEWIVAYIDRFSKPLKRSKPLLDYVFLTHFHTDHIGTKQEKAIEANGYELAGITMVAEHADIKKLVDRGFPDYSFPSRDAVLKSNPFMNDYFKFIAYQQQHRHTLVEGFDAGSCSQFLLQNNPVKYPDFKIQNIYVNGKVWTGEGTGTRIIHPDTASPDENMCSGAIKLTYGAFNYYTGGDSIGAPGRDVETHTGEIVGSVDAMIMNHHACPDATNACFLGKLKPRIMVIPAWHYQHPHPETLARMTDKSIYPGERLIFTTGMFKGIKDSLGEAVGAIIEPQGHIVIRAYEGGRKYRVFVLDSYSGKFEIRYSTDDINSNICKQKLI